MHELPPPPNRTYAGTKATAPGPTGPQMLRQFNSISRDPLQYLQEVWQEYGDVVQFPVPRPPSYLVNDPDAVREVLVGNWRNYTKSTIQYRSLSLVTGEGLLTADFESWRRQRPLVQPAFHHETLAAVAAQAGVVGERLREEWRGLEADAVVDVDAAMMKSALEVVGLALFGTDFTLDSQRLTRATLAALEVVIDRARPRLPLPEWLPTRSNRKLHWAVAELDGAVRQILDERGERTSESGNMVDLLLAARDETGGGLTAGEVRDQLVTFIVAGHETVASALTWSWALLAAHPDAQERLADEASAVLGGRAPQFEDFARLPYARAVMDEALRLYPPAWLITRKSVEGAELGGREVHPGSLIIMSPWLLHRHPAVWDDAEAFDPGRFLDKRFEREFFLPFGAGLRQCIGKDFAYVEGVLLLSMFAAEFELRPVAGGGLPRRVPQVTVRPPAGLPLRVRRR